MTRAEDIIALARMLLVYDADEGIHFMGAKRFQKTLIHAIKGFTFSDCSERAVMVSRLKTVEGGVEPLRDLLRLLKPGGVSVRRADGHSQDDLDRVECASCRSWVSPRWVDEERNESTLIMADDWHREGCLWVRWKNLVGA